LRPLALANAIAKLTLTKKANDVVIMNLRGLTSMADYFVVCSADSDTQLNAIAHAVEDGMESEGASPWHSEKGGGNWILLDFVDVVLHVFHKNARQFYSLEKLWGDAKIRSVTDKAPERPARSSKAKTTRKPARAKKVPVRRARKSLRKAAS